MKMDIEAVSPGRRRIPEGSPRNLIDSVERNQPIIVRMHPLLTASLEDMSIATIRKRIGDINIVVDHKHRWNPNVCQTTVEQFLSDIDNTEYYWRQVDMRLLYKGHLDMPRPRTPRCPTFFDYAWVGPAGTIQTFHQDNRNASFVNSNIFCQYVGSKYVAIAPPDVSAYFRKYPISSASSHHSSVSPFDRRAREKCPEIEDSILGPGDALYIPPCYWHYFKSLSSSVSVSRWWFSNFISELAYGLANRYPVVVPDGPLGPAAWRADVVRFGGILALEKALCSLPAELSCVMMSTLQRAYGISGGDIGRRSD